MNYLRRRNRLVKRLGKLKADAFLVSNIVNVRYLTGFTGSSAFLLLTPSKQILLSDTRYQTQLESECPDLELEIRDAGLTMYQSLARVVRASKLSSLAVESHKLYKSEFDQIQDELKTVALQNTQGEVESLRAIKDAEEVAAIRKSIDVNQRAFEVIAAQLTPGQNERQIAHNLEHQLRAFGAQGCAFDPIVGVGPRAALPHGQPSEQLVGAAPFLLIDWGANVQGYLSDLTRMVVYGRVTSKFRKIYDVVLEAQRAAIDTIAPGVERKAVDRAARAVIEERGFGKFFGHGTGHSFGLEIHEQPFLSPIHDGTLKAGMVLTVEPGIYLPGIAGVRIEDDVLVTREGREILSSLPKELDECVRHLGE